VFMASVAIGALQDLRPHAAMPDRGRGTARLRGVSRTAAAWMPWRSGRDLDLGQAPLEAAVRDRPRRAISLAISLWAGGRARRLQHQASPGLRPSAAKG